jgi:spore coat protein U-like protein
MKHRSWIRVTLGMATVVVQPTVWAAYNCTLTATHLSGVYAPSAHTDMSGTLIVQCTRDLTDAATMAYRVALPPGGTVANQRRLFRHGGSDVANSRLNHTIGRASFGVNDWTAGNATGTGAVSGTLNFGTGLTATASHTYYMRVTSGQTGKVAGIYDDVLTFTLRQGTNANTGTILATTSFTPTVSVVQACFVGTLGTGFFAAPGGVNPSTLTLNYTSFSPTVVSNSMSFSIHCTMGTPYTLALSPASGTLLGLPYTLGLNATSGTGTGFAQSIVVTGQIPAGLSGTCAASLGCSATQPTVLTVTY